MALKIFNKSNVIENKEEIELDKKSLEKAYDLYKGINYSNYTSFIDKSMELVRSANYEKGILERTIARSRKNYKSFSGLINRYGPSIPNYDRITPKKKINLEYDETKLLLAKYDVITKKVLEIKNEIEIRCKALDMFVEEEKDKWKKENEMVLSQQEKIHDFSRNIENICSNIIDTIKKTNVAKNKKKYISFVDRKLEKKDKSTYISFGEVSASSLGYFTHFHLSRELREYLLNELEKVVYKMEGETYKKEYTYKKEDGGNITKEDISRELKYCVKDDISYEYNWKFFTYHAPKEVLDDIYKVFADVYHKREIYRKEHFNDYIKYINTMNELIDRYENTPPTEWDMDYLYKEVYELGANISDYLRFFCNYGGICSYDDENTLDERIEYELRKRYYALSFLYGSIYGCEDTKYLIDKSKRDCDPYGMYGHEIYSYNFRYMEYLISQVEKKYDVSFPMEYNKNGKIRNLRNEYYQSCRFEAIGDRDYNPCPGYQIVERSTLFRKNLEMAKDLLLLLNGKEDFIDIYINVDNKFNLVDYIKKYVKFINIESFRPNHLEKEYSNNVYSLRNVNESVSLEEIYYIIKYLILSDKEFELECENDVNVYINRCEKEKKYCKEHINFLMQIEKKKIDYNYDSRILVIPKSIRLDIEDVLRLKYRKNNDNYNPIALYISTYDQLKELNDNYHVRKSNNKEEINYTRYDFNDLFKYIFIDEELYNEIMNKHLNIINDINTKLRVISKINHYSELSKHLDNELEKDNGKTLVKSN